jgi:hypothetical protein
MQTAQRMSALGQGPEQLFVSGGNLPRIAFFSSDALGTGVNHYITRKFRPKVPYRRHPAVTVY